MAIVVKDRVKETSTTTGTGTFTLDGAVTGFQAFSVIGDGNETYYAITDGTDWEVGVGTYTSSGTTLSRDTIFESSNSGNPVNWGAGLKDVFITYPAERAIYEEPSGETLIDGGPITVVGQGVTGYTSFSAVLAEMYGDINSFAQSYVQNLNDGSEASADIVAYNDEGDGIENFIDVGINSSNYSSATYPIFTPSSGYLFNDGGELFVGSATDDVVLFAGGVDAVDEAARIDGVTKDITTVADVNVGGDLDVTGAATFGSTVTLDADPTTGLEAATKQYVDNLVAAGVHFHQPVEYSTAAALPNSPTYNNGTSGVGATLTAGANAALVIDGVTLTSPTDNGIRVLVKNQASAFENGAYVVTEAGSGGAPWVLTRSSDADTYEIASPDGLSEGSTFYTSSGSTNAGSTFSCNTTGTITFGTTNITFTLISSAVTYIVQAPLNLTGNTLSLTGTVAATNGGTGTNTVTTGDLLYGSASNTWSKLPKGAAYKSLVMDGSGTNVEWNAVALNQSGAVSGALGPTNGGTGQSSYSTGDILYSSATNTLAKLAGNTTTTKKYLQQTGDGVNSAAPTWQQVDLTDGVTGDLPFSSLAQGSALSVLGVTGNATADNASIAAGTDHQVLRRSGTSVGFGSVALNQAAAITGTLPVGNGGTGQTSYVNGELLIGNTTGNTLAKSTLTAGSGITITNGAGSITIAASGGGTGDVVGPGSATDNAVARFDGITGKLIQNSAVTIADTSGDITTAGFVLTANGSTSGPAFTASGDTNTGVYFPGADRLGFATGGTQRGEFDASGNLLFNSGYGSVGVAYGCRAWVNFNGTGTVAINGSGNVSSITDNGGVGDYTINFTNAMPDANYAAAGISNRPGSTIAGVIAPRALTAPTTTSLRVVTTNDGGSLIDTSNGSIVIFR